jgi:TonB family protein
LTLAAIVYSQTLTPPQFLGGKEAFSNFLNKNLKWPSDNMDDTQGVVIVGFFVEKDGKLTDIHIEKSIRPIFDNEASRVIGLSPKWIPAFKNNKPIKSRYTVPISFTRAQ